MADESQPAQSGISNNPLGNSPPQLRSLGGELDWLCDQFENDWRAGRNPQIEAYLSRKPSDNHAELLRELLLVELELRREAGELPAPQDYIERFADQADFVRAVFAGPVHREPMKEVSLEQFVHQLEDTGILASDTIKDFIPPQASPKDAQELASELVDKKKLTKYQVEEVLQGKGKSLILGNYVLLEKIGAGGMGQVFKAEHRRMKRVVAVKLLPTQLTEDTTTVARFEREVEAAAKLSHPNIVTAFDADHANGVYFLVMELVEGCDLSALVKHHGPLPLPKAINFILQAATGLEAAHKCGIVHRDVKPANLLLDREGTVKILDMGLARLSGDENGAAKAELTNTGTVMGTVDYMAPEQALDTKSADARADIYSLGCSLHYLLTGKAIYGGDTLMSKLLAHRDQAIPALCSTLPDVPHELEAVFTKMVAKKADDRFQSMAEVIDALESCNSGNDQTVNLEHSLDSSANTSPTISFQSDSVTLPVSSTPGKSKRQGLLIAGGILGGLLLLAALVVKIRTPDGTLIVTVNEADAEVQVLNKEGKVEITRKGEKGPITIAVDPGKHRLKISKDGFELFTQEFSIESGGETPITAKLEPLQVKPAMVATKPASAPGEKKPLFFETPEFEPWAKDIAAMPAEQQVEAVSKKLVELNSGFDGSLKPSFGDGVVELTFNCEKVADISPVRALAGLRYLTCGGRSGTKTRTLSDLSPLQGMKLESLICSNTKVADLSPLQGMPLGYLDINGSRISDLSPLQGMPLTTLRCADCNLEAADLALLSELPLTTLYMNGLGVFDLSFLKGLPLNKLELYSTSISDLAPLKDMPLTYLNIGHTLVSDLSVLASMPLRELGFNFNPYQDITPLRNHKTLETINGVPAAEYCKAVDAYTLAAKLPRAFETPGFDEWIQKVSLLSADEQVAEVSKKLQELNPAFDGQVTPTIENGIVVGLQFISDSVTDISPLRALPDLKKLNCSRSAKWVQGGLGDLSPLQGIQLTDLTIEHSLVSDLSPLKGMQLQSLNINGFFTDLSPLSEMPLYYLNIGWSPVSDLLPLKRLPLASLWIHHTFVSDLSLLTGMPLSDLVCYGSPVSDLSPLREMSLKSLQCPLTKVTDHSPLKGLPLNFLTLSFRRERDTEIIRSLKSLQEVNLKPVAEFWKEVDTKYFGKYALSKAQSIKVSTSR